MQRALPVALSTLLVLCIGCGAAGSGAPPPAPEAADHGGMDHAGIDHAVAHGTHGHGVALPATAGPGYTVADVHFMQMMIGHHDQAVRMSALAPEREASDEVLALALRIDISQRDEIAMMERWLRERGQHVPSAEEAAAMRMPGLVGEGDFARLEAALGPRFDRLFLELMIEHHLGALVMVEELFASPGALQDSELFQFATDVGADQLDEIGIMERLLEILPTP